MDEQSFESYFGVGMILVFEKLRLKGVSIPVESLSDIRISISDIERKRREIEEMKKRKRLEEHKEWVLRMIEEQRKMAKEQEKMETELRKNYENLRRRKEALESKKKVFEKESFELKKHEESLDRLETKNILNAFDLMNPDFGMKKYSSAPNSPSKSRRIKRKKKSIIENINMKTFSRINFDETAVNKGDENDIEFDRRNLQTFGNRSKVNGKYDFGSSAKVFENLKKQHRK